MKRYTQAELDEILDKHELWLSDNTQGERACFFRANLYALCLYERDLRHATFKLTSLANATLDYADLSEAILTTVDFKGAGCIGTKFDGTKINNCNFIYADMARARLDKVASLHRTIGNGDQIKSIQIEPWHITFTKTHLQIGCQFHSIEDWWSFDDATLDEMHSKAVEWWQLWRKPLMRIVQMPDFDLSTQCNTTTREVDINVEEPSYICPRFPARTTIQIRDMFENAGLPTSGYDFFRMWTKAVEDAQKPEPTQASNLTIELPKLGSQVGDTYTVVIEKPKWVKPDDLENKK